MIPLPTEDPGGFLTSVVIIIASVILWIQNKKQSREVKRVKTTLEAPDGITSVNNKLDRLDEKVDHRFDALEREISSLHQEDSSLRRLLDAHMVESDFYIKLLKERGVL